MRRVVVTGLGLVTSLGCGVEVNWENLLAGKSGICAIQSFDISDLPAKIAGQVPVGETAEGLFNADDWMTPKDQRRMDNFIVYGLTAAIVTNDLARAMETAERVEAGYVWINSTGRYLGAPYGGWKQSGLGQEECFDELLSYTRIKNINMRW